MLSCRLYTYTTDVCSTLPSAFVSSEKTRFTDEPFDGGVSCSLDRTRACLQCFALRTTTNLCKITLGIHAILTFACARAGAVAVQYASRRELHAHRITSCKGDRSAFGKHTWAACAGDCPHTTSSRIISASELPSMPTVCGTAVGRQK